MFSHSAVHRGKQLAVFDTIHHLWFAVARWRAKMFREKSVVASDAALSHKMIKAVIQAIPTYVMSCFWLPAGIHDKMRSVISNRWWGVEDGKKKMHWRSWEWLTTPKTMGGMGFRDMVLFNQAMLGKQCWRIITEPDSLCARVLKGRYFPHTSFCNASTPRSSSYT
jgi:hypothetical protein